MAKEVGGVGARGTPVGRGDAESRSSQASSSGSDGSRLKRGEAKPGSSSVLGKKFLIGEELGFGAFSKVYKGVDLKNGDFVAIKLHCRLCMSVHRSTLVYIYVACAQHLLWFFEEAGIWNCSHDWLWNDVGET